MVDIDQRAAAVADLVRFRKPVDQAVRQLREFPWDCDEELVVLGPSELRAAIDRFIEGDISADELEKWGNAVEGRDDIKFESSEIIDLVAEIANPLLFAPLTESTMRDLLARLNDL